MDFINFRLNKIPTRIKFFSTMILIYLFLAVFNNSLFKQSFSGFIKMALEVFPILLFVYFVMFWINLFLKPEKIKKHLGEDSGVKGWLYAIISGILISGPPFVLYPLLADLKKHGMKDSLIAVFLYNRNVKIPFIPVMIYYFGIYYTITVSCLIIIFSILNGLLMGFILDKKN